MHTSRKKRLKNERNEASTFKNENKKEKIENTYYQRKN